MLFLVWIWILWQKKVTAHCVHFLLWAFEQSFSDPTPCFSIKCSITPIKRDRISPEVLWCYHMYSMYVVEECGIFSQSFLCMLTSFTTYLIYNWIGQRTGCPGTMRKLWTPSRLLKQWSHFPIVMWALKASFEDGTFWRAHSFCFQLRPMFDYTRF